MDNQEEALKLTDLISRTISINRSLLAEEEKFHKILDDGGEADTLKKIAEHMEELNRKETLYIGATRKRLEK